MKFHSSLWYSDRLELNWLDLLKLAFGRTLDAGSLKIKKGKISEH